MKKIVSLMLGLALTISCAGLTACGGNNSANDGKTITVKAFKAGYGTTWLYKAKEKFEALYAAEGYKVNILKPDNSLKGSAALADMRNSKKTGVDVYFVQSVDIASAIDEEYGSCILDISDIYDLPAIGFDGKEEDVKISGKLGSTYDSAIKSGDTYYSFMWASSPSGLVVNTRVLGEYGLSVPKTTDELFDCFKAIYDGDEGNGGKGGSKSTGVYPFAWAGNNAYGYALYSLYTNLGQILGREEYEKFMSLQQGDAVTEDDIANGATMYDNDDIYSSVGIMMREFNTTTSVAGSGNDTHDTAHYNVLTGKCAFIPDGEFFFQEAKVNYEQYLDDIAFINVPVNSDLGVKLKLDGSGNDREKCDEILSYVIDLVDEGKTNEQIIVAVSNEKDAEISVAQIESIAEARLCYYERKDHNAFISKWTDVPEVAKLFLRMCASDDFGDLFNETAYGYAPYSRRNTANSQYKFVNDCLSLVARDGAWGVSKLDSTGLRKAAGIEVYVEYGDDIVRKLCNTDCLYSTTNINQNETFKSTKSKIKTKIVSDWNGKMKNAGYNV